MSLSDYKLLLARMTDAELEAERRRRPRRADPVRGVGCDLLGARPPPLSVAHPQERR